MERKRKREGGRVRKEKIRKEWWRGKKKTEGRREERNKRK